MIKAILLGQVRTLLASGGGYLVANGLVTASQQEQLLGGALALVAAIGSWLDKRATKKSKTNS